MSETEAKTSTPRINLSPIYIFSLRIHISCAFSDDECSEEEDNGGEDVDFDDEHDAEVATASIAGSTTQLKTASI